MSAKTLFLDRDGVINRRIVGGYVCHASEFEFLPGVLEALALLAPRFDYIFIVTNQQGIGKGIFTEDDLATTHQYLIKEVTATGGRIDKIYCCPALEKDGSNNRKPNPGMGLQAKADYPDIDFKNATMVGDSKSDMLFGKNLGVKNVFLTNGEPLTDDVAALAEEVYVDLLDFAKKL
ncbi:MAG: HAD family hydrolase [Paludibacteraceae bacterium]|nr:HAD family hydrolase [Paludibacteraceae bacterium]